MISIEVFSEEKAWSKKLRKKELFFKEICNFFPKKYRFPNKKITFLYFSLIINVSKN
jgi:probable rRNA maturation factor